MTNFCSFYFNISECSAIKLYMSSQCNLFCCCCFPEQVFCVHSWRVCNLYFRCVFQTRRGYIRELFSIHQKVFSSKLTKGSRGSDFCSLLSPSALPPLNLFRQAIAGILACSAANYKVFNRQY